MPPRDVRPTSERARQAFFNIVADRIIGAHFLDLFAGSGVFAFEAVSRGAESAVAVDLSRHNVSAIEKLARDWGVNVRGVTSDVFKYLSAWRLAPGAWEQNRDTAQQDVVQNPGATREAPGAPTIIYADPPYDFPRYDDLLDALGTAAFAPGALIAVEHRRNTNLASETNHLELIRLAEYGEVRISMYERRLTGD